MQSIATFIKTVVNVLPKPRWYRHEVERLDRLTHKNTVSIASYTELSKRLQEEVNSNHFSPYLMYEKRGETNVDSKRCCPTSVVQY